MLALIVLRAEVLVRTSYALALQRWEDPAAGEGEEAAATDLQQEVSERRFHVENDLGQRLVARVLAAHARQEPLEVVLVLSGSPCARTHRALSTGSAAFLRVL